MDNITPSGLWALISSILAAIILIGNAAGQIAAAVKSAKAPNEEQNKRLDALEKWRDEVDGKLANDKKQLDDIQDGLRAIYQGQLALLDHGLEGNNMAQMEEAKKVLQRHLIGK